MVCLRPVAEEQKLRHDAEIQSLTDPSYNECNEVPAAAFRKLLDMVQSGEKEHDGENHRGGEGV